MSGRGGSGSTWGHVGSARVRSTSSRVEVDVGTPFKTSCRRSLSIGADIGRRGEKLRSRTDRRKEIVVLLCSDETAGESFVKNDLESS